MDPPSLSFPDNHRLFKRQTTCGDTLEGSIFKVLPKDLQIEIFCWLNIEDIGNVRVVNKLWNKLSRHDFIWKSLYQKNFGCDRKFETDAEKLFWGVKSNKLPIVSYLLTRNKSLVEATDKVGNFTPLYRAAQKGLLDMAKLLVKKGADVESTRGDGSTPFYIACQENKVEVAKFLMERGCNIECVFLAGFTPMYISAEMGNEEIVRMLVEKGANVNTKAERGATPIYIAAQNGHEQVVRYLIKCGADIECVFNDCYKPIYIANSRGHKNVVDALTQSGANVTGLTPQAV